jgi:hypothetical protein
MEEKRAMDVLRSRRFISFVVGIVLAVFVVPIVNQVFPEWMLNVADLQEQITNLVLVLIGGYTAQDLMTARFVALKK